MKRLIIVYNPRSSRYEDVKKDVLSKTKDLKGYMIGKYEVEKTNVDQNAQKLAKILKDHDFVLSAGGDATAAIAANGILLSKKDVTLAVLPYGNFNDLACTLGTKSFEDIFKKKTQVHKLYPLEIIIDQKFFRFATCYTTIGMTAEAVAIYDLPTLRKKLKTKFGRAVGSYLSLAGWYFKNRHYKTFLPEFLLNGTKVHPKTSDYAAVNGRFMARVMKGGKDYLDPHSFRSETDRLTSFWRLVRLMTKSIFKRIPGTPTKHDVLDFVKPATVVLQAEGEYRTFKDIHQIQIKKGDKCLKIITN